MIDAADEAMTALYLYALVHQGTPSGELVTRALLASKPTPDDTDGALVYVATAIGLLHILDEHIDGADDHRNALAGSFRVALVADEVAAGVGA